MGHTYKHIEGQNHMPEANYAGIIFNMFKFLKENNLRPELAKYMIAVIHEHPKMDFESVLESIRFKKVTRDDLVSLIPFLKKKFRETARVANETNEVNWIMGELRKKAVGNIMLKELATHINQ
jgi:glutamyl-tRNA(Gln) amidotransferase subunit E